MQTTKEPAGPRNEFHAFPQTLTIGIDLGDRSGHYCILDQKGIVVEEGRVKMMRKEVTMHLNPVGVARNPDLASDLTIKAAMKFPQRPTREFVREKRIETKARRKTATTNLGAGFSDQRTSGIQDS